MFWTPRWLIRHAVALALIAAFLALGRWQLSRAVDGNVLSYAYTVEWPVFAAFVAFVWYREVRQARAERAGRAEDAPRPHEKSAPPPVRSSRPARTGPGYDDGDDPRLAAYNRYLAWLNANPDAKPADYRER